MDYLFAILSDLSSSPCITIVFYCCWFYGTSMPSQKLPPAGRMLMVVSIRKSRLPFWTNTVMSPVTLTWISPIFSPGLTLSKSHAKPLRLGLTVSLTHSLMEPPIVQLLKNFPAFYGTRRFITVFIRALHWSLSWARSIQSIPSHISKIHFNIVYPPAPWSSKVISFHLTLLPISYIHISSPLSCYMPCPSHLPWHDHSNSPKVTYFLLCLVK
jgi:hypothetical protein